MNRQVTQSQENISRLQWVDNLKAIGIVLVVFAHNHIDPRITQYIYAFHMPLFFFLSGVLYNGDKYNYCEFINRKFQTRIKPYLILSLITYLFWMCVVIPLSVHGEANQVDKFKAFLGIFYGIGTGVWRNQMAVALWFLPCLFCVELLFYAIVQTARSSEKRIFLYFFFVIIAGCLLSQSNWLPWRMPWSMDMALIAVVFYAAGYLFTSLWKKIQGQEFSVRNIFFVSGLIFCGLWLSRLNGRIDMSSNHINNPVLFIVTPFFFIIPLIYFFRNVRSSLLTFLGNNTLPILAYHFIALFMIRSVIYLMSGNPQPFRSITILANVLLVAAEILVLYPIIFIHNKFLGRVMR